MKIFFLIYVLFLANFALAATLTNKEIRDRFELKADIYTVDATGKKVVSGPNWSSTSNMNPETGVMDNNWSVHTNGNKLFLRMQSKLQDDGTFNVVVEEYKGMEKGMEKKEGNPFHGLLQKKEFSFSAFEPVILWPKTDNPEKIMVRLIPGLREDTKAISMEGIPISGTDITVTDSRGFMWADGLTLGGKYTGMKTHRGALVLSYTPFKGGKELGIAEGKKMVLNIDKNFKIKITSSTDFLPNGLAAKVFALYEPNKKSDSVNSVHSWDSKSEARIAEGFRN